MQGRFRSAWQQAVVACEQNAVSSRANGAGSSREAEQQSIIPPRGFMHLLMGSQESPGPSSRAGVAGASSEAAAATAPLAPLQQQPQQAVRPPRGPYMQLLLGSQSTPPESTTPRAVQPAAHENWRNVDLTDVYQRAYAQGLAERMQRARQQEQQEYQQRQQLLFQSFCDLIGAGRGTTPAVNPAAAAAAATAHGAFEGKL